MYLNEGFCIKILGVMTFVVLFSNSFLLMIDYITFVFFFFFLFVICDYLLGKKIRFEDAKMIVFCIKINDSILYI